MAGLRELKARLGSIQTVGQLAGAMRTVSAAKYSRVSTVRTGFGTYAESCRSLMDRFGPALSEAISQGDPEAPICYVVVAGNRGLCGGYNAEILSFGAETLRQEQRPWKLITVGKTARRYFEEAEFPVERAFEIPDVPEVSGCRELMDHLRQGYVAGEFSGVILVYQKFINMLSREARQEQILPLAVGDSPSGGRVLMVPDRQTVLNAAAVACVDAVLYSCLLEAAACCQAATLVAMRSAYDNAQESILDLETEISRKRQSEVTAGVLETASDNGG